ncbi:hypothetical protein [Leuconostoc citreum]|uniref:hypothetical protein n=1 Tax=Leuconostoc citreum TaxID=33964 RepID=UPI001C5E6417
MLFCAVITFTVSFLISLICSRFEPLIDKTTVKPIKSKPKILNQILFFIIVSSFQW